MLAQNDASEIALGTVPGTVPPVTPEVSLETEPAATNRSPYRYLG